MCKKYTIHLHPNQNTLHMKKMIISLVSLLLWANSSKAIEILSIAEKQPDSSESAIYATTSTSLAPSVLLLAEENQKLRLQTEELKGQVDNLKDKLGYTQMMHITISNLQTVISSKIEEDAQSQLDYARMMHATIVNLEILANQAN